MTTKYLGYAVDSCQMGNYTAMIPGLIDVSFHSVIRIEYNLTAFSQ